MIPDRRLRVYHVAEEMLRDLLAAGLAGGPSSRLAVPRLVGLPPDADLLNVGFDVDRRTFRVLAWHPSFACVPAGQELPDHSAELTWREYRLQPDGEYRGA